VVTALEVGVAAAVTAGVVNWLWLRKEPAAADGPAGVTQGAGDVPGTDDGHLIYLDPWADDEDDEDADPPPRPGPSSLP
jgi:hypothetical protein